MFIYIYITFQPKNTQTFFFFLFFLFLKLKLIKKENMQKVELYLNFYYFNFFLLKN